VHYSTENNQIRAKKNYNISWKPNPKSQESTQLPNCRQNQYTMVTATARKETASSAQEYELLPGLG